MKMKINIFNETDDNLKTVEKLIKMIFKPIKEKHTFNIIFVSDEKIRSLNQTYRGIDKVTDVLSFLEEDDGYIGDVFIALDQAKRQALEYNHSLDREIGFLVTHGYLHLLGFDHQTEAEEIKMRTKQEAILKQADLERIR